MKSISIRMRDPLPATEEALAERLSELLRARQAIDNELKEIIGATKHLPERHYSCLRCGHDWQPKKITTTFLDPRYCPNCHTTYWNKPRRYVRLNKPSKKRIELQQDNASTVEIPANDYEKQGYATVTQYKEKLAEANGYKTPAELDRALVMGQLAPPPVAPMSLRERLAQLSKEPSDVEIPLEPVPVTGEESVTDSPEQKSVVEEVPNATD